MPESPTHGPYVHRHVQHTFTRSAVRKDKRGIHLICEGLPFGRLWYAGLNAISNAIGYAAHRSRSRDAVIRVYDNAGNMIEMYEHAGEFKEP